MSYILKQENMDLNQGSLSILVDILIVIAKFHLLWPVSPPTNRNLMRIDTKGLLVYKKNHYLEGSTDLKQGEQASKSQQSSHPH